MMSREKKEKEKNTMKTMKNINIKITIKQVESRSGEYIAYYTSDFLGATFSVYFQDSIMGAIALHDFSEMLKGRYEKERIEFDVCEEKMRFKSRDLLEAMAGSELHSGLQ